MLELTQWQFILHVLSHPFEGFEDLRWKKSGSFWIALGVIFMLFFQQVAYARLYGFQYHIDYDKIFNIVPYIFQSFLIFGVFVIANWAMCTLFDGEGTMRNIFIYTAYSLIPYIIGYLIGTVLSHVLIQDEYVFIQAFQIIGLAWTVLLFFTSQKAVHQFTVPKTIALILLTFVAMIAVLFLLVLLLTLFQQVIIFIMSIYTELTYRFRV